MIYFHNGRRASGLNITFATALPFELISVITEATRKATL
jgi:hypothetical protein